MGGKLQIIEKKNLQLMNDISESQARFCKEKIDNQNLVTKLHNEINTLNTQLKQKEAQYSKTLKQHQQEYKVDKEEKGAEFTDGIKLLKHQIFQKDGMIQSLEEKIRLIEDELEKIGQDRDNDIKTLLNEIEGYKADITAKGQTIEKNNGSFAN